MRRCRLFVLLFTAILAQAAVFAQHAPDFAEKFMTLYKSDSTLKCITVSPKMMEQLAGKHEEGRTENMIQAIAKLKSARIVSGNADYYQKAVELLEKNKNRFKAEREFRKETSHGAFFLRRDKGGNTVEMVMLREEPQNDKFTIVNLTGDIDEEFLCFLYNNRSFKN